MRYYLIILFLGLFTEITFSQECLCGKNGFGSSEGDLPEFVFKFPDAQPLAFCGYLDKKESDSSYYISEFNVFACDSSENLLGYSAVHYCNVFFVNDSVFINRLTSFPIGQRKAWIKIPFSQRTITSINGKLLISDETVILQFPDSMNIETHKVLSTTYKGLNYDDISNYLGEITILALEGNEQAVGILFSKELENYCDAAVAEHLMDCKEMYNWAVKGNKNKRYWL